MYRTPLKDMSFVLHHVLKVQEADIPGYADLDQGFTSAILEEAAKLSEEVLAPLNAVGDKEGCRLENGVVRTPKGFQAAFDALRQGGWTAIDCDTDHGGQGLPYILHTAVNEPFVSSNMALNMYQGLTHGAYSALRAHGSPEQKALYLPKLATCEWTGTMNLTEPHCGTDLGLIRTRAEPQADGSYAITGTKIFISAGDHDLTENIIHLVLAKTPDAPESTKGISLFIVPKVLVNEDGSLGARNAVSCGSIEHKMGIHANSTCVMNYDGATGWMVGEENKGLAAMFIMMNAARLGVGIQGLSQAEAAYQNAVKYAQERRQGRALTGPAEPGEKADTLFVHPDVRRMLMDAKAYTEGMRALCLWGALQVDLSHKAANEADRQMADDLISLLTPVIKGYGTDKGFDTCVQMQQVFGGHGFIEEWGMSQFVRDCRITQIYEGANGVQAMDLVGRKLAQNGGRAVQALFALVDQECAAAKAKPELEKLAGQVEKACGELKAATMWFMQNGMTNPNHVGAGAHHYMHMMGIVSLGLMWLRMAELALAKLAEGTEDKAFYEAKLVTARYYGERFTPDAGALRRKLESGADALMALPVEAFATA